MAFDAANNAFSPSADRNRMPIAEKLIPYLSRNQWFRVLEVGSLTGQHANTFCAIDPQLYWYPTDLLENIETLYLGINSDQKNIAPPQSLNVGQVSDWQKYKNDSIQCLYTSNTFHIMDWQHVKLFWQNSAQLHSLQSIVVYGPFFDSQIKTAASNESFHRSLQQRYPGGGLRQLERVISLAETMQYKLTQDVFMPANNRLLFFEKN